MLKDRVSVQSLRGVHNQKLLDESLCRVTNVIPVWRREVKLTSRDECEQLSIIVIEEGREAAQPAFKSTKLASE